MGNGGVHDVAKGEKSDISTAVLTAKQDGQDRVFGCPVEISLADCK
jgi:hypothetical protein